MSPDLRDRFICRREGHKPMVKITHVSGNVGTSYQTRCLRCGEWITVDLEFKDAP